MFPKTGNILSCKLLLHKGSLIKQRFVRRQTEVRLFCEEEWIEQKYCVQEKHFCEVKDSSRSVVIERSDHGLAGGLNRCIGCLASLKCSNLSTLGPDGRPDRHYRLGQHLDDYSGRLLLVEG